MKNDRLNSSLHNCKLALQSLEEFLAEPVRTNRDRAGIIQAFEFTFELVWKTLQKIAQEEGLQVATPRQAFSSALQAGFIFPEEEPLWLAMMKDRNLTSDTYRQELALEIVQRVRTSYYPLFTALVQRVEERLGG